MKILKQLDMNYNIADFDKIDNQKFREENSQECEFEISFSLSSIGSSKYSIDIVSDYSTVSYCCEKIVPFIKVIYSGFVTRDKFYTDFRIKCKAIDLKSLENELLYFSKIYYGDSLEYDDIDRISFYDEVLEYEESFNKRTFVFPELINSYWANLINGAYWEIASEYYESESIFFNKTYRKYPEHRFGFWKSPLSKMFQETIYFSTENWIIPPNTNVFEALRVYSGLEYELILEDADKIEYNGIIVLITNSAAVYFNPKEQLQNSIKCTELVLSKIHNNTKLDNLFFETSKEIQTNLFGEKSKLKKSRRRPQYYNDIHFNDDEVKYKVSEFGDLITVEYKGFTYIFFSNDTLNFEEIKSLNSYLYPAYAKTQNLIDNSISEECDWLELNDDTFEELCYDILYCHPHFDSSTIQKMGKSRSRDGGRDIVANAGQIDHPTPDETDHLRRSKLTTKNRSKLTT